MAEEGEGVWEARRENMSVEASRSKVWLGLGGLELWWRRTMVWQGKGGKGD